MQNHTKRSATDIRLAIFKKAVRHNKVVRDEAMRNLLGCSTATYQKELRFYLQSMQGVVHDTYFHVVGFPPEIEKLIGEIKA